MRHKHRLFGYCNHDEIIWSKSQIITELNGAQTAQKCRSGVKLSGYFCTMLSVSSLQNYFYKKSLFT